VARRRAHRPNILLLFTDQHRLSALGCYGRTPCRTPTIDRLAAEGVRFQTCYTPCPVCSPTRASILTGLYPHAHGVLSNVHNLGSNVSELPDGPHLLSRRLAAAGYRCGYTGKWHMGEGRARDRFGAEQSPALPTTRGFEGQDFPGHGGGGFKYPEYRQYLAAGGWEHQVRPLPADGVKAWPYGVLEGPVESSVPHFLAEHTISLIDRFADAGEPFFLWHNNWGPHGPFFVPQEYYDMYRGVEIPPWPSFRWEQFDSCRPYELKRHPEAPHLPWEKWAEAIRHYYAFATLIDHEFGRILAHLQRRGLADNTVVIFTSDHGQTLGSHGGLTDKGWHHFEETHRVGLIVKDPRPRADGAPPAGHVEPRWASVLDVHPTVCELAGAEYDPQAVHGRSLLPLLEGRDVPWRETAFVEFHGVNSVATTMITCRHGNLKYGWNAGAADELYDLAADPHEMHNLADAADAALRAGAPAGPEASGSPGASAGSAAGSAAGGRGAAYAGALADMRRRVYTFLHETGHGARSMFAQSRLGWLPYRQFPPGQDPIDPDTWNVPVAW